MDEWPKVTIPAVVGGVLVILVVVTAGWLGWAKWVVAFTALTVFFSAISAGFWFWAARLPIRQKVWIQATVGEGGPSKDLDVVLQQLRRQSQWNAMAAGSMFIAVAFQLCAACSAQLYCG